MKWAICIGLIVFVGIGWFTFCSKAREVEKLQERIEKVRDAGDPEGKVGEMESDLGSLEGEKTFTGLLLTFFSTGLVGILFVIYILPFFAHRVTHAIYDSAEMVEKDVMHEARVRVAQGDYEGAIDSFRQAANAEPQNRLPWVEIVKIQKDHLGDPQAAVQTIFSALANPWQVDDAAFFMFRLAELYDEALEDRASAVGVIRQVMDEFPRTRHSANAQTKLHEWGVHDHQAAVVPARVEPPPPTALNDDACQPADRDGAEKSV